MKKPTVNSCDDLVRLIVERPVWAYLHVGMGMAEEINENGADMLDAIKEIVSNGLYLAACIGVALGHFAMIAVYPVTKAHRLRKARRDLMPEYRRILRQPAE